MALDFQWRSILNSVRHGAEFQFAWNRHRLSPIKELGLTQSQIDQIKKIADEELRQIQDKRVEVAREWYATLCNVLLDHQKKILDEQFGPPPKPMLTIFSLYLE